jgi:alkylhydroperoxidase family enzyme
MARIEGITHGGNLLTRLAFFISQRQYGKVLQPLRIGALDMRLLLAFGHMELAQQRARQMPGELKELARMLAGMQVNCPWCIDIGVLESRKMGIPEEKLRALLEYEHSPLFTQEEVLVLRYAEAMTRTPLRVPDELFEALKAIYTDRQIAELTFLIAWENCVARFNHALGIEADGLSGDAYCLLPSAHHISNEPGTSKT